MKTDYIRMIEGLLTDGLTGKTETFENLDSTFEMQEEVKPDDLIECKSFFHDRLPADYVRFLKRFNGGIFYKVQDFSGFQFLSAQELIVENSNQKENFGEDWDNDIILFCLIMGDGEFIGFKVNPNLDYQIVNCIMEEKSSSWEIISSNFDELMSKLLIEKGKKFWL